MDWFTLASIIGGIAGATAALVKMPGYWRGETREQLMANIGYFWPFDDRLVPRYVGTLHIAVAGFSFGLMGALGVSSPSGLVATVTIVVGSAGFSVGLVVWLVLVATGRPQRLLAPWARKDR